MIKQGQVLLLTERMGTMCTDRLSYKLPILSRCRCNE